MKVLLDENLPHQLRFEIAGHEVFTAAVMGWSGVENGKLLALAVDKGFDVLITNDRGLEYQQAQASLPLGVIVLLVSANTIEAIRPLLPQLHKALDTMVPRTLVKVQP